MEIPSRLQFKMELNTLKPRKTGLLSFIKKVNKLSGLFRKMKKMRKLKVHIKL